MNGFDVLKYIKEKDKNIYVIILSGQQDVKTASDLMKFGAYDYIADIFCVSDDKIIMVARSASDFWAIRIMEPGGTIPSGIETQLQEQVEINLVRNRVIVCSTDLINGQVRVADLSGRTLQLREINHTQQFEMDLNHLTRGIYFVTVYTGNKNHTKKIFLKD